MKKFTVLQYADQLKEMTKDMRVAVQKPLGKGRTKMKRALVKHYRGHHVGSIIWQWRKRRFGKAKTGPVVNTERVKFSTSEDAYMTTIGIDGMAAWIDEGLALRRLVVHGKTVRSPGVRLKRRQGFFRIVNTEWDLIEKYAARELEQVIMKKF